MPSNLRPDHSQSMVCGTIWQVLMTRPPYIQCSAVKTVDGSWSMHEQPFETDFFVPMTLTLTWWPSYTNLTSIPWRYTGHANMNKAFESYRLTDIHTNRQTDRQMPSKLYTTLPCRWSIIKTAKLDNWYSSIHKQFNVNVVFAFKRLFSSKPQQVFHYHICSHIFNKKLSYCRETVLQGALVLAESRRLELGDNILRTL